MEILHCNHPHPLLSWRLETGLSCNVCLLGITKLPIYGCKSCNYFSHKSCAELQKNLLHPFHPQHPLVLRPDSSTEDWCAACCRSFVEGCSAYHCKDCNLNLCIDCMPQKPSLKWEGHEHLLAMIKAYHGYSFCGFCNFPCCNGETVLHCVPCDYVLHPRCITELPETIQLHHRHSLQLNETLIENEEEELYCDVCENLRTPNQLVYSCKECDFVADLYCALYEILPNILNKEVGENDGSNDFEDTLDPVTADINKQISVLHHHSVELTKILDDLAMRAKEVNQEIDRVKKEVKMLEQKRAERVSSRLH